MSTKHVLSGGCEKSVVAFLFAGLLVCFCVCVFLTNALMNPALSNLCTHESRALRHKPLLSDLIKGRLSYSISLLRSDLPSSLVLALQILSWVRYVKHFLCFVTY